MKKAHAIHNEELCEFLLQSKKFNDWVVTAAFYSALHYVHNELFPRKEGSVTYQCFEDYFNSVMKSPSRTLSKHAATIRLVDQHFRPINAQYRWLHDNCMTTRYNNYIVDDRTAQEAKRYLLKIKSEMIK
ncbi:MAG: hypothetical protein IPP32_16470 [Bacteroidetes bacterium]|nr:hypothetical protein [Bacteroidota bacterium]